MTYSCSKYFFLRAKQVDFILVQKEMGNENISKKSSKHMISERNVYHLQNGEMIIYESQPISKQEYERRNRQAQPHQNQFSTIPNSFKQSSLQEKKEKIQYQHINFPESRNKSPQIISMQQQTDTFANIQQSLNPHTQLTHGQLERKKNHHQNEIESQLKGIIKEFQRKIQEAQAFGKKMKDPMKFRQFQAEALQIYLQKIRDMNLPDRLVNQHGKSIKILVGRISAGKSSLINSFFGLKLPVGVGETTMSAGLVYSDDRVQIYDTPGQCETFNTKNLDVVKEIASSNEVYILYNDSLKTIEHLVRVIVAIKPNNTILLRTQCDMFSKKSNRTLEQEIEEDHNILRKWKIEDIKIYATSAKQSDKFEGQLVKAMMKGKLEK